MTPIELIHALERKKAALYGDVQVLDDVITCLKRTRHETIADLETKMELEFGHGWKALKEYLSGDVESKQKRANGA